METLSFDKLLLETAFCCMASDGNIDRREVALIKEMCDKSLLFKDYNFDEEINVLVRDINANSTEFISNYFQLLSKASLSVQEELTLIEFAINTIKADEVIDYSEIKFFKVIRHNLKVGNEKILAVFPDIEQFLEDDIVTESYLTKITNQYLETTKLPQFELNVAFDIGSLNIPTKDD